MTAYRTSGHCESCNVLREEIERLKNPEDEVVAHPFQLLNKTICPFCAYILTYAERSGYLQFCVEKRTVISTGRWFRAPKITVQNKHCPQITHFHKQCFVCSGKWVEETKAK